MILEMVAEGKITPEEGARLLEAIGGKKTRGSRGRASHNWGEWFDNVFSGDPFQADSDRSPKSIPVSGETGLVVRSHVGSLVIVGTDEEELRVSGAPRGHYRLSRPDDDILIRTVHPTGTLTVHMPKTITGLTVKSHVGRILAQNLSNSLRECEIRSHTGNIAVDTQTLLTGRFSIRSHVGRIEFFMPRASAAHVSARCRLGGVDCSLPLDTTEREPGRIEGLLNGGGADIRLQSHMGQVYLGEKVTD